MVISDAATDITASKQEERCPSKGSGRATQSFAPDPGPNLASSFAKWARQDSNLGQTDYESAALTS